MLDCVATDTTSRRVDVLLSAPDAVTRTAVRLSGHTHGGQIALPLVESDATSEMGAHVPRVLSGSGARRCLSPKELARLAIMPSSAPGDSLAAPSVPARCASTGTGTPTSGSRGGWVGGVTLGLDSDASRIQARLLIAYLDNGQGVMAADFDRRIAMILLA